MNVIRTILNKVTLADNRGPRQKGEIARSETLPKAKQEAKKKVEEVQKRSYQRKVPTRKASSASGKQEEDSPESKLDSKPNSED